MRLFKYLERDKRYPNLGKGVDQNYIKLNWCISFCIKGFRDFYYILYFVNNKYINSINIFLDTVLLWYYDTNQRYFSMPTLSKVINFEVYALRI